MAQKPWLIFRDHLHKAEEWSIPMSMKLDKNARRPVWRNQDLLAIIKYEEEAYREWKPAQATYMECRDIVWAPMDKVGKAVSQMELNPARDVKNSK